MNQIETSRILLLDPSLTKASSIKDWKKSRRSRSCLFAKYFPKYLRNFEFQTEGGTINSKMKRIKVMKHFRDLASRPSSKALRNHSFFENKAKFLKTLNGYHSASPAQLLQKLKFLTNLKSIRLSFGQKPRNFFLPEEIERQALIKTLAKIKRLNNLKSLKLDQLINSSSSFIHAIDTYPRVLSRLKTLTLSTISVEGDDHRILKTLNDCKNILKYVTSLYLPALRFPSHLNAFKSLENSCPNLKNLGFEFAARNIIYDPMKAARYSETCFPVEVNYLSAIETFHNLRTLRLSIADIFTFLNDFRPPPLIQSLLLNFEESLTREILTRIHKKFSSENEEQTLEFFETNKTLTKFYDNFQHLYHLKTLDMTFTSDAGPEDCQYHNYLAQCIVKKVPSLNKLSLAGGYSYWGLNNSFIRSSAQDLYLSQFFTSCHPSRQVLQTLEIGHEKVIFSNFNLVSSRNKFPSLSAITLTGTVHQNDPSNTEIGILLKQVLALGTSLTTVKFHTFIHGSIESLLSLLQQLSKLRRPQKLQLKLQIKFSDTKILEDLGSGFASVIQELQENQLEYPKLKGVSLLIYMNEAKHAKDFLEVYGKKFDNFKVCCLGYQLGYMN